MGVVKERSRHGFTLAALASVAAVPLGPVALVLFFVAEHLASYRGSCGPYPTDIPAYPCGLGEYLVNFFEPFAMAGLVALSVGVMLLTVAALTLAWALGVTVWWIGQRAERR